MREDFNKLLTERERLGHTKKFGDIRNCKANKDLDPDMSGGKQSMHGQRRNAKGEPSGRKAFNENLNPLKNYLRVNVGRPWDKIYSEITQTFDKRKVVNNHILEHLFQYVELKVYIIDGKPCTLNTSRYGADREYDPITTSPRYPTYYVDPRDGIMKVPKQGKTRNQRVSEMAAEYEAERNRLYRKIDADNHLFFKDGIWWHYTAKAKPGKVEETYYLPLRWKNYAEQVKMLSETPEERELRKRTRLVDGPTPDKIDTPSIPGFTDNQWGVGPRIIPKEKYFFSKKTASHKQLKNAGVAGTIVAQEIPPLSHREASKYRVKKV